MEPMCVARERGINILRYVDFSNIFNVFNYFVELKQNIVIEDISFTLSYSLRYI